MIVYILFIFIDKRPWNGKGRSKWRFDKLALAHHLAEYIQFDLHATSDFKDTEGPYMFILHPHGVLGKIGVMECGLNNNEAFRIGLTLLRIPPSSQPNSTFWISDCVHST